jgi:K+-sensing histidine kinase KdpD
VKGPINILRSRGAGYLSAVAGIALVTAVCAPFYSRINNTSVALAMLLVVLFVAAQWGSRPAFVASVLGVLCFNFFLLPPIFSFTIADPQNWVALTAFLVTAVITGQLWEREKQRAAEVEAGRREARVASAYNRSLIEASLDAMVAIAFAAAPGPTPRRSEATTRWKRSSTSTSSASWRARRPPTKPRGSWHRRFDAVAQTSEIRAGAVAAAAGQSLARHRDPS